MVNTNNSGINVTTPRTNKGKTLLETFGQPDGTPHQAPTTEEHEMEQNTTDAADALDGPEGEETPASEPAAPVEVPAPSEEPEQKPEEQPMPEPKKTPVKKEKKTTTTKTSPAKKEQTMPKIATTDKPATKKTQAPAKETKGKKPAAKAAPSTNGHTPREKKEGLRGPQVRILQALKKSTDGMTRNEISSKANVDLASLSGYIGSYDPARRANDDQKLMSLLSLKYVKVEKRDIDGKDTHITSITASGRKALEKFEK
jgi:hypothetical protein